MIEELERNGGSVCKDFKTEPCTHIVVDNANVSNMPGDVKKEVSFCLRFLQFQLRESKLFSLLNVPFTFLHRFTWLKLNGFGLRSKWMLARRRRCTCSLTTSGHFSARGPLISARVLQVGSNLDSDRY